MLKKKELENLSQELKYGKDATDIHKTRELPKMLITSLKLKKEYIEQKKTNKTKKASGERGRAEQRQAAEAALAC